MYTRGGFSTVEKPPLVNKPKIYKGRLGEVREARGGKSTKPRKVLNFTLKEYFLHHKGHNHLEKQLWHELMYLELY